MNKFVMVFLAAAFVAAAHAAAKTGSIESAATSLGVGKSITVKLVPEYDPDEKTYDEDSGVYFLKTTLTKGYAYTLAYTGASADDVDVNGYPRETTEAEDEKDIYSPSASFSDDGDYNGIYVQYLQSDEWDSEDPSTWLYYIEIRGDVGASVTVSLQSGIIKYAEPGSIDNPTKLTFSEKSTSDSYTFVDGEYYFTASLKAGRFYRMRTTGGTAAAPVFLEPSTEDAEFELVQDAEHASDTNNTSFIIAPAENATFLFVASGTSSSFGLVWQAIPTRSIAAHPFVALEDANGYSASFTPGRINSSYSYADNIIDEHLCRISVAAGERWVFSTERATAESEMRLYDSKGEILAVNATMGNGSYDTRIGYEFPKSGVYYVGVCEPTLGVADAPTGSEIDLTAVKVVASDADPDEWDARDDVPAGATPLAPLPADDTINPITTGGSSGPHRLGVTDWADCFQIGARKGLTYVLTAELSGAETTDLTLEAEVFTLNGSTESKVSFSGGIDPTDDDYLTFVASASKTYYVRVKVAQGNGLDYPDYTVYVTAYDPKGSELGLLQVFTKGVNATWSIGSESVKYDSGVSVLMPAGSHTVKFASVNGFTTPPNATVSVTPGGVPTVVTGVYSDKFDPGDNTDKGAIAWSIKNKTSSLARTLWAEDTADHFSFTAAGGEYYSIKLEDVTGDAVFSITNAELGVVVEGVTEISKMALPKTKAKYIIVVTHGGEEPKDGSYTISGYLASVGDIMFDKSQISAKENADTVKLTVKRGGKDGVVRVRYGTVAGTAMPGVDYVAQNGVLEWADGDNKSKQIAIKLIPDLVPEYDGAKVFSVRLEGIDAADIESDEYPAQIAGVNPATITLTEVSKAGTQPEDAYAKTYVKPATVKTESVPLYTGTFAGLLQEEGGGLTNGFPKLAYVTLTASVKDALSAKVSLAGKTYSFSAKAWDEKDESFGCYKLFEQVQKVAGVAYTNTLAVSLSGGTSYAEGDWAFAGGTAELVMNVPDSDNKGVQELVSYTGELYRDNSKIQEFLNVVTNYAGYYTVALVPDGVNVGDDVPAGNGFVTLTIDAKGKVKVAGQLSDGKTKPSVSAMAAIEGDNLVVPVYFGKKPMCFGGVVRIALRDEEVGVKSAFVDSSSLLAWYNDDASQTYYGEEGWGIGLVPVGGWYDKVVNLQAYYKASSLQVMAPGVDELPEEALASGYEWVMDNGSEANETSVSVVGDKFDTAKQMLVKDSVSKLYDFSASTNAANVKVSLNRATGLVTGSFVVWSFNGKTQKNTSIKHQGVLLFNRDETAQVDPEIASFGYFTIPNIKLSSYNEATKRTSTRNWSFSAPFNLLAVDQGEPDWWADDWGEQPAE